MEICIDFDGTCVTHDFPETGKDIGAVPVLKELIANKHRLILFTMRSNTIKGSFLTDAVNWFKENDIELYGIQANPTQHTWTTSPKAYGHLFIDDAALGIPLVRNKGDRPYVDWTKVRHMLVAQGYIKCEHKNTSTSFMGGSEYMIKCEDCNTILEE
jgi:hypothetical protein